MIGKYKVITLCGSTRFKDDFLKLQQKLTLEGNIVLTCGVFTHADDMVISEEDKEMLDDMHRHKIDMSDEIYVVNKHEYIGESTRQEIEYARLKGILIKYLCECSK